MDTEKTSAGNMEPFKPPGSDVFVFWFFFWMGICHMTAEVSSSSVTL